MANSKIYADLAAAASLVAADVFPVVVDTAGTPTTKSATLQKLLDLTYAFGTIQCPAGTSPAADAASDTLTLTSTGGTLTITGDSATDTINFEVASPGIGGSTGSVDNAILRADGTGGSTAQAGAATYIDDSGNIGINITTPGTLISISSNERCLEIRGNGTAADSQGVLLLAGEAGSPGEGYGRIVWAGYNAGFTAGAQDQAQIHVRNKAATNKPEFEFALASDYTDTSADVVMLLTKQGGYPCLDFYTGAYANLSYNGTKVITFNGNGIFSDIAGSAATPAYNFAADNDNGMYYVGTNSIGFSTGGTARLTIGSTGTSTFSGIISGPNGTAADPGIQVATGAGLTGNLYAGAYDLGLVGATGTEYLLFDGTNAVFGVHVFPPSSGGRNLGSNSFPWGQIWGLTHYGRYYYSGGSGYGLVLDDQGTANYAKFTVHDGTVAQALFFHGDAARQHHIYVEANSAADGTAATSLVINAANKTAGSGNGGALTLAGGTSSSGTAGSVVLKTAGTDRLTIGAAGESVFSGQVQGPAGSAGAPAISFSADPNTGIRGGSDVLTLTTAGTDAFSINASGVLKNLLAGSESTGAGTATAPTNCPAVTPGNPYTWLKVLSSDGSTCYIPMWK